MNYIKKVFCDRAKLDKRIDLKFPYLVLLFASSRGGGASAFLFSKISFNTRGRGEEGRTRIFWVV